MQERKKADQQRNQVQDGIKGQNLAGEAPNASNLLAKMDGRIKVIHGANDEEFELVGQKVSSVRASLVDAFNIPGDALALVNGEQVNNDYVLVANDTLEFIKAAGVKGAPATKPR
jgi:hypothetical protein